MRQAGNDSDKVRFRDILLRLRNAQVTMQDWNCLMEQTPTQVADLTPFVLRLYPTVEAVVQYSRTSLIRIARDQTPSEYMKFPD